MTLKIARFVMLLNQNHHKLMERMMVQHSQFATAVILLAHRNMDVSFTLLNKQVTKASHKENNNLLSSQMRPVFHWLSLHELRKNKRALLDSPKTCSHKNRIQISDWKTSFHCMVKPVNT